MLTKQGSFGFYTFFELHCDFCIMYQLFLSQYFKNIPQLWTTFFVISDLELQQQLLVIYLRFVVYLCVLLLLYSTPEKGVLIQIKINIYSNNKILWQFLVFLGRS